jgi:hypothetical protein
MQFSPFGDKKMGGLEFLGGKLFIGEECFSAFKIHEPIKRVELGVDVVGMPTGVAVRVQNVIKVEYAK